MRQDERPVQFPPARQRRGGSRPLTVGLAALAGLLLGLLLLLSLVIWWPAGAGTGRLGMPSPADRGTALDPAAVAATNAAIRVALQPTATPPLPPTATPVPTTIATPTATPTPPPTPTLPPTPVPPPTPTAISTAPPTPTAAPVESLPPTSTMPPVPPPARAGSGLSGTLLYSSDKEGAWALYQVSADGGGERRLTGLGADNYNGAWSPDGRSIAFVSERDGNPEIYVMAADGTGARRLTNDPQEDEYPVWSPDGRSLIFVSNRGGSGNSAFALYQMPSSGGAAARIVNAPASWPTWSRDGTIVFTRWTAGYQAIYATTLSAPQIRLIARSPGADDDIPTFSPDGAFLAFSSGPAKTNRQIVVARADGGNRTTLTSVAADNSDPIWSPDGAWIAYASDQSGPFQIYLMRADGSATRAITTGPGKKWYLSWKP